MEDAKTAAKRQAIEAEGTPAPKAVEVKRSRFDRRLEKRKKEILDKLVYGYFTQRSSISDPEGQEAANLFDSFEGEWRMECKTFNRGRQPFKLIYEAFSKSVEFYLKMEKNQMAKTAEENKGIGFEHWFRRTMKFPNIQWLPRLIWYFVISLGNNEKQMKRWKAYYIKCNLQNVK